MVYLMKYCILTLGLVATVTACAAHQVDLEKYRTAGTSETVVRSISYDDKGLPVLGVPLEQRPSKPGDHFTIVWMNQNRPQISYDVAVTRHAPDLAKPFLVVYEWTGKGFNVGFEASEVMAQSLRAGTYSNEEAIAALAFVVTPMAAGTVGGFVIGLADGVRHTALELGKVVSGTEQVVTCTLYDYDDLNRISVMRMLTPDRTRELVRTEFMYQGTDRQPVKTIVKSLVEEKERAVK